MADPTQQQARVLVIEDDDDVRDALLVLLHAHGWPSVGVTTGAQAMALLKQGLRPQAIILDLMLPGATGLEFRAEQLSDPDIAAIPTIVVSAVVQGESVRRALHATEFLPKPIDIDRLVDIIRSYDPGPPPSA